MSTKEFQSRQWAAAAWSALVNAVELIFHINTYLVQYSHGIQPMQFKHEEGHSLKKKTFWICSYVTFKYSIILKHRKLFEMFSCFIFFQLFNEDSFHLWFKIKMVTHHNKKGNAHWVICLHSRKAKSFTKEDKFSGGLFCFTAALLWASVHRYSVRKNWNDLNVSNSPGDRSCFLLKKIYVKVLLFLLFLFFLPMRKHCDVWL